VDRAGPGRTAARSGGSPLPRPPFCSFLATSVDPSPNFGGGVQGKSRRASDVALRGAVLPLSARNERGGGRGEGPSLQGGGSCAPAGALSPDRLFACSSQRRSTPPPTSGEGGAGTDRCASGGLARNRPAGPGAECSARCRAPALSRGRARSFGPAMDDVGSAAAGQALRKSHHQASGASPLPRAVCGRGVGRGGRLPRVEPGGIGCPFRVRDARPQGREGPDRVDG
jgi:hypothetical protein